MDYSHKQLDEVIWEEMKYLIVKTIPYTKFVQLFQYTYLEHVPIYGGMV